MARAFAASAVLKLLSALVLASSAPDLALALAVRSVFARGTTRDAGLGLIWPFGAKQMFASLRPEACPYPEASGRLRARRGRR